MPNGVNRQILLKSRPKGVPTPDDFELVESRVPKPGEGELLGQTVYLSLDPYVRGRLNATRPGDVVEGATISRVVESRHPALKAGDFVVGDNGWQEYAVASGSGVRKLDPAEAPIVTALSVLGMTGMTAYFALREIGQPRAGETVVVSAAAGAVGSVAGEIARNSGCRVIGITGSETKCRFVVEGLGFAGCVNHHSADLDADLASACPDGIDVYFDNVGGRVLDAVLNHVNAHARIPLVGLISQYNAVTPPPGPNLGRVLANRVTIRGFMVRDHVDRAAEFYADVGRWLREGKIGHHEDIVVGLENAPRAFIGLFEGKNVGKLLVRVSDDPTSHHQSR